MNTRPLFLLLALLPWVVPVRAQAQVAATPVELIGPAELFPGSTLEFRFARPMVAPEGLGPAVESPVTFDPPLAGSFVWLSTRSGVFLSEGPLTLGQKWTARLRNGLKDAAGNVVVTSRQGAVAEVFTPPFQLVFEQSGVWAAEDVAPNVEPRLAYNAAVDLASVRGVFRAQDGRAIPAKVRFATENDYFPSPPGLEIWGEELETNSQATPSVTEFTNRLIFSPEKPLSPAAGWILEVASGVRSTTGLIAAGEAQIIELGEVRSLQLSVITPQNLVLSGPMVQLNFNLPLAPDITPETAAEFFRFEPVPENLRWTIDWNGVTARGAFPVGKPVKLIIGEGVVGSDGRRFSGPREREFTIGHVLPRLYLPTVTGQQLRFGRREFPVRWVNLEGLDFSAVRIEPKDLPAARQAMLGYAKTDWDAEAPDEIYQPVPADLIRGQKLKLPPMTLPEAALDRPVELALPWNQILGEQKPGAVFLTVQGRPKPGVGGPSPGAQALIQLTDTGLFWKQDRSGLHALAFSMQTGRSLPGVTLSLWNEAGERFTEARTGADGRAVLPISQLPSWLLAENGSDAEIIPLGFNAETLPVWNFRIPVDYGSWVAGESPEGEGWRGMIFSDRPLYQAGETIRVRGFLRRISAAKLAVPDSTEVRVALFGPSGEEVAAQLVKTGAQGDFSTEFPAPLSPRGEFRLAFDPGVEPFGWWQAIGETPIVVADFQPDAFEVKPRFASSRQEDAPSEATVTANYFFGGAVGPATVRWVLQTAPTNFNPPGFSGFQFLASPEDRPAVGTSSGSAEIAAGAGQVSLVLPAAAPTTFPLQQGLTVEVTDINQQTVSAQTTRRIESADFYLGLALSRPGIARAGENISFRTVAVQPDGQPTEQPVNFTASLIWRKPNVLRVMGAGQAVSFQTTMEDVPVATLKGVTARPELRGEEWSVGEASALSMELPQPGSYLLRVVAQDGQGREVVSEQMLYAAGDEETVWDYNNPYELELVPEKASYAPGETARILIKNPLPGPAVVFVERGQKILRSWPMMLEGNAPVIEVPLSAEDAPNVFVSVALLRGSDQSPRKFPMPEFRHGLCQLRVKNPQADLGVKVSVDRPVTEPGETIRATVQVAGADGKGVAGAGVTLWAVDDGILNLTGYERPDLGRVFQAPLPLGVRTGVSLGFLLPENPADLQFANKGYLIGGGGIDIAGLRFRENFPGTILWRTDLVTGPDGRVTAELTAPDALTRYRILAVAHEGADRFGGGETSVAIRQPLMLLSGMGMSAHEGDELTARAVLRNQSGSGQKVRWTFGVRGASSDGPASGEIDLADGASAVLETPVVFSETGTARLEWTARAEASGGVELADALAVELSVRSPMLTLREVYFPELAPGENDLTAGVNPQVLEGNGEVALSVANTRLVGLGESADYLWQYPYGCAEQTASALVPWVVADLQPLLPSFREEAAKAPEIIRETLARLSDFRTPGGGLGFWPGVSETSALGTAWAAVVWARAFEAEPTSQKLPANVITWLEQSLREEPRDSDPAAWTQRALTLYALALHDKAQPAYMETTLQRAGILPPDARAFLALALATTSGEEGAAERQKAAVGLLASRSGAEAGFDPFASPARSQALYLLALATIMPDSPKIAPTVAELLESRKREGRWNNTQANAWALLALDRYRRNVELGQSGKPLAGARIALLQGELKAGSKTVPISLPGPVEPAEVAVQSNWPTEGSERSLELQVPKGAKWFGQTRFAITPPLGVQPAQNRGFGVTRTYRKIEPDGSLSPAENLQVGDRVLVTLELQSAQPGTLVAMVDPLPAILEAINPDFRPERAGVLPEGANFAEPDFRETLASEVRFFVDRLEAGRQVFAYLARVRQAGTATAPGSKVEEMYRPERFGLGTADTLKATAK